MPKAGQRLRFGFAGFGARLNCGGGFGVNRLRERAPILALQLRGAERQGGGGRRDSGQRRGRRRGGGLGGDEHPPERIALITRPAPKPTTNNAAADAASMPHCRARERLPARV